ncbi:hypothetical protein J802_4416, partial [Acinetobacter baumannii 45002_9]
MLNHCNPTAFSFGIEFFFREIRKLKFVVVSI